MLAGQETVTESRHGKDGHSRSYADDAAKGPVTTFIRLFNRNDKDLRRAPSVRYNGANQH
jgi:hypothetical protein